MDTDFVKRPVSAPKCPDPVCLRSQVLEGMPGIVVDRYLQPSGLRVLGLSIEFTVEIVWSKGIINN